METPVPDYTTRQLPTRLLPLAKAAILAAALLGCSLSASQTVLSKPFSLFGSPSCGEWQDMNAESRFGWTSGFLSTLSMGHETSRRTGKQKFKDQKGIDEVVEAINRHCKATPMAQASEAAAPFLNP